ncbi:probable inactive ribonuclease-like protein 13 [Trichosurus vulpecula]|uniref:probable inactive ribonuclease-like protein 13 n=1 Tax=Trichosurus vulpecula TaxID=9337 RepID=UPI00186B17B8|nr:probable inactive ribonuclease-like protein 13 [Trichosurus vulpecula]
MVLSRILVLQLLLVPALTFLSFISSEVRNFRILHIDYPKVTFHEGFQGYCNGLMSFVRGWKKEWHCPWIHYVLHAPWTKVSRNCKYTDSFCEDFNEYCSLSQDAFFLTTCERLPLEPPSTCQYNETTSTRRVYLLCSRKYNGEPMYIIGVL